MRTPMEEPTGTAANTVERIVQTDTSVPERKRPIIDIIEERRKILKS